MKRNRRKAKKRHRQSEQATRKLWVEQHKTCHTYGKETPKSSRKRKVERDREIKCRIKKGKLSITDDLGSEYGSLVAEFVDESIANNKVIDQIGCNLTSDDSDNDESLLSSSDGNDNSILNSSGIDSDLEEFIISSVKCTCSIEKSSHQRSCPLNPRNRGKSPDVEYIKSEDVMPLTVGKTPSTDWINSAALLIQIILGRLLV